MEYTIKKMAQLSGVSPRTLRFTMKSVFETSKDHIFRLSYLWTKRSGPSATYFVLSFACIQIGTDPRDIRRPKI